ncbi:MAG: hypothetical protein Q4Q00_00615 [Turicibacter sp.]|nr:hypothetical protein [Turicibacter sp.]
MSEIKIRKLTSHEINAITDRAKMKKFSSREAYIRHLIQKDLHEEVHMSSHLRYVQLIEQLIAYIDSSDRIIEENNAIIRNYLYLK